MHIAVITTRRAALAALRSSLEQRGVHVESHSEAGSLLRAARTRAWDLVVVDGCRFPFRELVEQLLEIDARVNTAVVTELAPEAFREASEGLGILASLPPCPSPADADRLLDRLGGPGHDAAVQAAQHRLDAMCRRHHPRCVVCWERHPFGLKVDFRATGEHTVEGVFDCGKSYEGFRNVLHGGIVSSLLDGAMASCILAKGLEAYTVDLRIRFRAPVDVGMPVLVRGEWIRQANHLHLLQATLLQEDVPRASARAKFMEGSPGRETLILHPGTPLRGLLKHGRQRIP